MNHFQFIVPTLFGLEGLAGDELRRMDMENVRVEDRRVFFTGDERALAKANICLRTGERVMVVLAQFTAKTFEELFQGVYHANLEDFIPRDGQFPVKGHCLNSQLMSVSDCQAIIKKAASKRLGEKYGVSWLPETGVKFQLHFTILNDQVTLSLDTSGQGLHKRGYRAVGNDAPLRETLAAAMILTADALADKLIFKTGKHLTVEEIAEFLKSKASVSAGERGYSYMCDWVALNANKFDAENKGDVYGIIEGDYAYVNQSVFRKACKDAGFDDRALLSWMKSNGIILTRGKRNTRGKRLNGVNVECVAMRMKECDTYEGDEYNMLL